MKKLFYGALALAGVFAVSCNKEMEAPVTPDQSEPTFTTYTIEATIGTEETRTAYADFQKFSWKADDAIDVLTYNEETEYYQIKTFTAQADGVTTVFSGELEDGYVPANLAVYPDNGGFIESDFAVYLPSAFFMDDTTGDYYSADSDNPLENLTLVGRINDEGTAYAFQTAVGALKVSFSNLPEEARFLRIYSSTEKISGYFRVDDADCITNETAVPGTYTTDSGNTYNYSSGNLWYHFTPAADGTITLYIPLPVGKLSAGTVFYIENEEEEVLYQKTTVKDITIERNKVTELTVLSTAYDWKSLGTGKFIDSFNWYVADFTDGVYVDVEILQDNADPNHFRLVDPYGAAMAAFNYTAPDGTAAPSEFFDIYVDADGYVDYPQICTGIYYSTYEEATTLLSPQSAYGKGPQGLNLVAKYQANGLPANILIAPSYYWPVAGYWTGNNYYNSSEEIQVVFPGATSSVDITASAKFVEIVDDTPAQAVASVDVNLGNDIASAKLVIAANEADAIAALTAGTGVATVSVTGLSDAEVNLPANAPSGDYYVFMQTQVAEGLSDAANQLITSEKFHYDNAETDRAIPLSDLYGQWEGDIVRWTGSTGYYSDTFSITFDETDDEFAGDFLITEIYGDEATIPAYATFDSKTGILTIATDQPYCSANDTYDIGIVDAQSPDKDLVFRYREDGTLYLQSCEFVAFYLYYSGTTEQSDYWLGYFYGDSEDYHLTMNKVSTAGAPAKVKMNHQNAHQAISSVSSFVRRNTVSAAAPVSVRR